MGKFIDLTGKKFGRLTVTSRAPRNKFGQTQWACRCLCGKSTVVPANSLKRKHTKSCGCLRVDKTGETKKTHGFSRKNKVEIFYKKFRTMCTRVNNPNSDQFHNYGGRGIQCLWESFETFYADMHESYVLHVKQYGRNRTTLERIDNNGHYCKENCRWATPLEQSRNKRSNKILSFRGEEHCVSEWAEILGVSQFTLYSRLARSWSTDRVLATPIRGQK